MKQMPDSFDGTLRKSMLKVPEAIRECSGIVIFGRRIKSLVFSTDLAIIRNVNADAVFAVYPFTPQPVITQAIVSASSLPVFAGCGGGLTNGQRAVDLAANAETLGVAGVVLNAPTSNEVISKVASAVDIPVVVSVVNNKDDIAARVEAGVNIFNVSASKQTPGIVKSIREQFPTVPIIATGGPTDETILATIEAGANAITWTPPSCAELFTEVMDAYRNGLPHP